MGCHRIGESISGAIFSPDGLYRYALWRIWERQKPMVLIVGLNPSKAGRFKDDPTIIRGINFAKHWGYGGLWWGNIFGLISTRPYRLRWAADAVGPDNDHYLAMMRASSDKAVAAWGNWKFRDRAGDILALLGKPIYCLGVTKSGQPRHPLYLPYSVELKEYLPAPQFKG